MLATGSTFFLLRARNPRIARRTKTEFDPRQRLPHLLPRRLVALNETPVGVRELFVVYLDFTDDI